MFEAANGIATGPLSRTGKRNIRSPEVIVRLCDIWRAVADGPAEGEFVHG